MGKPLFISTRYPARKPRTAISCSNTARRRRPTGWRILPYRIEQLLGTKKLAEMERRPGRWEGQRRARCVPGGGQAGGAQ